MNGKQLSIQDKHKSNTSCVSLCSRSIRILQKKPNHPFPGKIRLQGVASLNLVSVAIGQTIAALEATPKIWDLASAWLILSELGCPIQWLKIDPNNLDSGKDVSDISFPLIAASSEEELRKFIPWGKALKEEYH